MLHRCIVAWSCNLEGLMLQRIHVAPFPLRVVCISKKVTNHLSILNTHVHIYKYICDIYILNKFIYYILGKSWYVTRNPFKSSQRLAHGSCHTRLRIMLHFPHRVERIVVWFEVVGLEDWPRHSGHRNTMRNRTEKINLISPNINQILQLKIKTFESRMV